jgi:hypothetical protein
MKFYSLEYKGTHNLTMKDKTKKENLLFHFDNTGRKSKVIT